MKKEIQISRRDLVVVHNEKMNKFNQRILVEWVSDNGEDFIGVQIGGKRCKGKTKDATLLIKRS